VTGLVVLMIGLSLVRVGIEYAAGGVTCAASGLWFARKLALAGVVVVVTLGLKFFGRGVFSTAAVLLGLLVGYGAPWPWARSISRRWGRRTG
jgi:NCS2 family nucleobase:cation symporter-2